MDRLHNSSMVGKGTFPVFLARSLVWLQSEKATFPACEESVSENLNENYNAKASRNILQNSMKKISREKCDFHRNKREEGLNNPSLRKNCSFKRNFKTFNFSKGKKYIYLRTDA